MLKALVIFPNDKTHDLGDLLQISRAEARKREHTETNLPIMAIHYIAELKVYVAVYEAVSHEIKGENTSPNTQKTPTACSTRQNQRERHV